MELHPQFRLSLLPDGAVDRTNRVGEGRAQPRLHIAEQRVGGRDPWDEAPTCGLTGESRVKWADQHRRHGSLDGTRRDAATEHALRTKRVRQQYVSIPTAVVGI